ncbi:unnamed protein product [Didymodactylos carnosus]|uniref:Uncharacterized protein n=2 Tax=Didymodactylos carnosus TaxID=1234261 RepID=A0A814AU68_9BILA|nr:unnamed protein product [Didymodactylos carnosus]CAF3697379.1 unnamed protein product [Didymodactylos carnosus]
MLEVEITQQRSIHTTKWEIVLGMNVYQVIKLLKLNDDQVKSVTLVYNDKDPLSADYTLNLSNDSILLHFDSVTQRLKLIELYDLKKVKLKYFPQVIPTIDIVNNVFGPTRPGDYNRESQSFLMHFPGLTFFFNQIGPQVETKSMHGLSSLQFPDGQSPVVSKIYIYAGDVPLEFIVPPLPVHCFNRSVFLDKLSNLTENQKTIGIACRLIVEAHATKSYDADNHIDYLDAAVHFDDTCQDVLSVIGSPNSVYYKTEDKIKIRNPASINSSSQRSQENSDYFFNYLNFGLDILFDGMNHTVKKFILHTNFPCHYLFDSYFPCNFELTVKNYSTGKDLTVTPSTRWPAIQEIFDNHLKPCILNRSSSINTTNPFGPTFCHLVNDMIFEVMNNGYCASVIFINHKD